MITRYQFHTARMERWISERNADLSTRPPKIDEGPFNKESTTYDPVLSVGQIRLLPIWMCGPVPRCLVYAAVLKSLPEDLWEIAVFSPYGEPACQNEFRTSFAAQNEPPDLALRVLSLWNAFPIPGELLGKSWIIHELPHDDLAAIEKIRASSPSELQPGLRLRLGPPPDITALALSELCSYMIEEEAIADTILAHVEDPAVQAGNIIVPDLWQKVIAREARIPDLGIAAQLAKNFAVWVTNVPARIFAEKAADPDYPTPLRLLTEATDFWKNTPPDISQDPGDHIQLAWKTETTFDVEPDFQFTKVSYSLHNPAKSIFHHRPEIPNAEALLYDSATARLIGTGSASPGGLKITLDSTFAPQGPIQIVLCKKF